MSLETDVLYARRRKNAPPALEKKPEISKEQYVKDRANAFERSLEVKEGLLPIDHPVTQYVQSRLKALYPDQALRARVADRVSEPNAMALPNSTIVITRGLLSMMENQDELDVVLCHEARHIICKHTTEFEEALDEGVKDEGTVGGAISGVLRTQGLLRFHEYEADLRGLMDAMKGRTNPTAFRSIFLKIDSYAKEERKKELKTLRAKGEAGGREPLGDGGETHGTTVDRLLFVGLLAQLYDFDAPTSTVDFPSVLKEHLAIPATAPLEEELSREMTDASIERIKTATLNELLHALKIHLPKREAIASGKDRPKQWYLESDDELKETMRERLAAADHIILQLTNAVDARIGACHPVMAPAERVVLRDALIEMGGGIERELASSTSDVDPSFVLKKEVLEPLQPVLDVTGVYSYYRKVLAHRTLSNSAKKRSFETGDYAKQAVEGVAAVQEVVRVWAGEKESAGDPLQGIWDHALPLLTSEPEKFEQLVIDVIEQAVAVGIEIKPMHTLLSLRSSIDRATRNKRGFRIGIANIIYRHPEVFQGLFPPMLRERQSLPLLYLFDVVSPRALEDSSDIEGIGRQLDTLPSCRDIFLEKDKEKLDQILEDSEGLFFGSDYEPDEDYHDPEDVGEMSELRDWIRRRLFRSVKTIEEAYALMKELGWLRDQVSEVSRGESRQNHLFRASAVFVTAVSELLENNKMGLAKQPKQRFLQIVHLLSGINSAVARYALDELLFTDWQQAFPKTEDLYELLDVLEGRAGAIGCEAIPIRKISPSALLENTANKLLNHVYREIIYRLSAVVVEDLGARSPRFIEKGKLPSGYGKETVMGGGRAAQCKNIFSYLSRSADFLDERSRYAFAHDR